jgi:hypothetical protein
MMGRPEQIPEGVWGWLPAFPFEFPGICGVLPLPRVFLEKWCEGEEAGDIQLGGFSISPKAVQVGESVCISCRAQNVGSAHAQKTVTLKLNGSSAGSQLVSLNPGEAVDVAFQATPQAEGSYQVQLNGFSGSFTASAAPPAAFVYTSGLNIQPWGGPNDIQWDITVMNTGSVAGTCHMEIWDRLRSSRGQWQDFFLRKSDEVTIEPGASHTFTGTGGRSGYQYQLMAKSEAGTILNPDSPLEFICKCCFAIDKSVVSFASEEELAAHQVEAHSEYLPMAPCTRLYLRGTFPPNIAQWWAKAYFGRTREDILEDHAETLPVSGQSYVQPGDTLEFVPPAGWETSRRGPCGNIPNSAFFDIYIGTVDGEWYSPLATSPFVSRIPDGSIVTFECTTGGCYNWDAGG